MAEAMTHQAMEEVSKRESPLACPARPQKGELSDVRSTSTRASPASARRSLS